MAPWWVEEISQRQAGTLGDIYGRRKILAADLVLLGWALLAPMLIMMVAFTFGILKIPTLVNDIFAGRSGSSALPSRLM